METKCLSRPRFRIYYYIVVHWNWDFKIRPWFWMFVYNFRSNKKYFEVFGITTTAQEMLRSMGTDNAFLALNLKSILFNLNIKSGVSTSSNVSMLSIGSLSTTWYHQVENAKMYTVKSLKSSWEETHAKATSSTRWLWKCGWIVLLYFTRWQPGTSAWFKRFTSEEGRQW